MSAVWGLVSGLLLKAGFALVKTIPVERIVAYGLNYLIGKVSSAKVERVTEEAEKASRTAKHLCELVDLFVSILDDKVVTQDEVDHLREMVLKEKEELLRMWANGQNAKEQQAKLTGLGESGTYTAKPPME